MSLLHIAGGATEDKLDASDVFSSYVRTGTGADVTVTTNIDMTKGYMVWTKGRSGATDHAIYDSARGVTKDLVTNATSAETTQSTGLKAVSTTGHTIGSLAKMNTIGATYVDWVFRKAPKFFDIVTYTGDGVAGRQIPHNLGCEVGMIIVKRTDIIVNWFTYHRTQGAGKYMSINLTNSETINSTVWNGTEPTTTNFTVGSVSGSNALGGTYVAYLFAHDPSADGIIQCGSFTTDASGNATVTLGWEPQYVLIKPSSTVGGWLVYDTARGIVTGGNDNRLRLDTSDAEYIGDEIDISSSGFYCKNSGANAIHIYLAIRIPNKVPTSGTEVYNAIARTGTGAAATVTGVGFAPDVGFLQARPSGYYRSVIDRLRGVKKSLITSSTAAEADYPTAVKSFDMDGVSFTDTTFNNGGISYINHFFRRAKGFFDIVCYTGTGVARTVNHNLGVVPELMIVRNRNNGAGWRVYHSSQITGDFAGGVLSSPITPYFSSTPTTTEFSVGVGGYQTNQSGFTYVAYLFASCPNVSKVGSYTGNGTSRTIPCGFSTGARFVLIKRTDETGDWFIWDTARGIVATNDPHLSLNTTAAEVTTDDSIDPEASGFIVNQNTATNINVNGASYIFLSIS